MSKYTTYMMKFSQSELRGYLGQGMVDLLIEWLPNGDTLLTKQRMISMIDSIYGTSILKDKNFRKNCNYSAPRLGYINFWSKQRKYNFCFIIALLRKVDNFSM